MGFCGFDSESSEVVAPSVVWFSSFAVVSSASVASVVADSSVVSSSVVDSSASVVSSSSWEETLKGILKKIEKTH